MLWLELSQGSAARNQLSMWRQLQLQTEMSGMHRGAEAMALCQLCQALPMCLLPHVLDVLDHSALLGK